MREPAGCWGMPHCAAEAQWEREPTQGLPEIWQPPTLTLFSLPHPRRNSQLTVCVCVDDFHEEGISSIQALLWAGSGILWSSRVQAYKDRLMAKPPFSSATGTLPGPPCTYLGSPFDSESPNKNPRVEN